MCGNPDTKAHSPTSSSACTCISIKHKVSTCDCDAKHSCLNIYVMSILLNAATHSECLSILPCLYEVVFLGVNAITLETFGKVVVPFPSGGPLVHCHDLVAVADGWVNLNRVPLHDLVPFYSVNLCFWRYVELGLDRSF